MYLKNLKRKYIVQLLFLCIPLLIFLVSPSLTSLLENLITYRWMLILLLTLVLLLYAYILLLKNHIDNIEKIKTDKLDSEPTKELKDIDLEPLHQALHELSREEKEYLNRYFTNDTKTQYFDLNDGIASGLANMKIIYRTSILGKPGTFKFPYNIQPWAWRYLKKNKHLLK